MLAVFPPAGWLFRFLDRRTRLAAGVDGAARVDGTGVLRSTLWTGFAWYLLAHSQHTFLPLIQIADLTGAYGVSFLVAAVNALLFEILWRRPVIRPWLAGPDTPCRRAAWACSYRDCRPVPR